MQRGCQGIVLFGSTGEGPSFSIEERQQTLKHLIQLGVDPQRLILTISCCAVADAAKLASIAREQKCLAVLIAPPCFYKHVEEAGIIAFYREVIQKVAHPDLRILLYHIPQFSGVPMTLSIIKTLKEEFPHQIIGVKDSEGRFAFTRELLLNFPDLKIFVGNEGQMAQAVQLGAVGGISGIANIFPELICSLYAYGLDPQKSNQQERIQQIIKTLKNYPLFPALKKLVEQKKGIAWHFLRPPLFPLNETQSQKLFLDILS